MSDQPQTPGPINHRAVRKMARELGCHAADLIALAPHNDPFYIGTHGDQTKAQWFARLWHGFHFDHGVHLRRIHYRIISQKKPVSMPNGQPYENTEVCWDLLAQAGKAARYLGLVDPDAFDDRRNPDPVVYATAQADHPTLHVVNDDIGSDLSLPGFPAPPTLKLEKFAGHQRYHLEVWCEKSTMNDVLLPLCKEYGANLVTGVGEMSITAVRQLMTRIEQVGKPVRLFYLSDFDPAGQSMPVAVARKIEYFARQAGPGLDVKLFPVVLTEAQVRRYRLPRTPIKESERRKAGFEHRHGAGATELDALEALHPGELRNILTRELDRYYDQSLEERVAEAAQRLNQMLDRIEGAALADHAEAMAGLRREYDSIQQEFGRRVEAWRSRAEEVWRAVRKEIEANEPEPDQVHVPEAREADERDHPLYDSQRDYIAQLNAYKRFQGKPVIHPDGQHKL
jgi:hypothetical protein